MNLSGLSAKDLEKKVLERKAWLQKVIEFAESLVPKYGKCLAHKQHSSHTYSEHLLEDFNGFSFLLKGAMSMFGMMCLTVYQLQGKEKEIKKEILDINYESGKESITVNSCVDEDTWIKELKFTVRYKRKFLIKMKKEKDLKEKQGDASILKDSLRRKLLRS